MSTEKEVGRIASFIKKYPIACVLLGLNVGGGLGLIAAIFV